MSKQQDREYEDFERKEEEFQNLIAELHDVERSVLRDTERPFTQERFHDILTEFCNVIAKAVRAESCTIQLSLYDPSETRIEGSRPQHDMEDVLNGNNAQVCRCPDDARETRRKNYQSVLTFPYWWSGKGVLRLEGTNTQITCYADFPSRANKRDHAQMDFAQRVEKDVERKFPAWRHALYDDARNKDSMLPEPSPKRHKPKDLAYMHLKVGITTIIVQDKLARVRDRWRIREMRNWNKLGTSDSEIWDNSDWTRIFRNYYGVPIRIHAGGEAVGLLKLENKAWEPGRLQDAKLFEVFNAGRGGKLNEVLRILDSLFAESGEKDVSEDNFARNAESPAKATGPDEFEEYSYLARAYLLLDLLSVRSRQNPSETTFFQLFDGYDNLRNNPTVALPTQDRPPIQLFARTPKAERIFLGLVRTDLPVPAVPGFDIAAKHSLSKAVGLLKRLCRETVKFKGNLGPLKSGGYADGIAIVLRAALVDALGENAAAWDIQQPMLQQVDTDEEQAHFGYTITLVKTGVADPKPDLEKLELICVVPPTKKELRVLKWKGPLAPCSGFYSSFANGRSLPKTLERNGEFVLFRRPKGLTGKTIRVRDWWIDRMAARMQALVFSIRVPAFSHDDSRLLTWVAFEIGKLVERRIAYHANQGRHPMPLTSIEFFRLPISDVSFVEDLKGRCAAAERVKNHLDHHLQNQIFISNINDFHRYVRYDSRMKGYGSYLARLGERWEGHIRGSLATYLFLLRQALPSHHRQDTKSTQDLEDFRQALDDFCKKLSRVKNVQRELGNDLGILCSRDFVAAMKTWIGDVDFASPPLANTLSRSQIVSARDTLVRNLACTGLDLAKAVDRKQAMTNPDFLTLIFRNYDPFVSASASLLCQVLNRLPTGNTEVSFPKFYRAAFRFKELLSKSWRELEEEGLDDLREFWEESAGQVGIGNGGTEWGKLVQYVAKRETKHFMSDFPMAEPRWEDPYADNTPAILLPLTATGIYKRVRMLNDMLHRQRPSAHLDWLTGRFDLLGCRLNCLYKNQVFALYERIWKAGDPFFFYKDAERDPATIKSEKAKCPAEFTADPPPESHRTRWLALRTNVHYGKYRALHVAALADPGAIEIGHWERDRYNLRKLKLVLGRIFKRYEQSERNQYIGYAFHRDLFRQEYLAWFCNADAKLRHEEPRRANDRHEKGERQAAPSFGTFLCEGVFDLILDRFEEVKGKGHTQVAEFWKTLRPLSVSLGKLLNAGVRYTQNGLTQMRTLTLNSLSQRVDWNPRKGLRDAARNLYAQAKSAPWLVKGDREQHRQHLKDEENRLLVEPWRSGGARWRLPAIWVPKERFDDWEGTAALLDKRAADPISGDNALAARTLVAVERLIRLWEAVRREQKEFLFYRGSQAAPVGLDLRARESVLHRIMNYVLLFDPRQFKGEKFEEGGQSVLKGWTAYDLFCYVRSLIPLEIQIRTAFSDTLAEEYHDAIYKGRPKKGTGPPLRRLDELSNRLAEVDNEMEIDFEDFADRQIESIGNDEKP